MLNPPVPPYAVRQQLRDATLAVGREPICVYCHGRVDRDEDGPFYWVPEFNGDEPSMQDAYPMAEGEACCAGPLLELPLVNNTPAFEAPFALTAVVVERKGKQGGLF